MKESRICPVCNKNSRKIFIGGGILKKYEIQYFQCPNCSLVYTEEPYWLDEAYSDSITCVDTGIMGRNVEMSLITNLIVAKYFNTHAKFLDYGGGYGIFTRMMRDFGYEWLWQDKFSPNLMARGFEYLSGDVVELITAFKLFEHFVNPMQEIENLFSISKSILFSTLIYDEKDRYKKFEEWWYYVPATGQHISFYSRKTLEYIAETFHVNYYQINEGLHLFTDKKLPKHKLNGYSKRLFSKIQKVLYYKLNSRNSLAVSDMEKMSQKYKG